MRRIRPQERPVLPVQELVLLEVLVEELCGMPAPIPADDAERLAAQLALHLHLRENGKPKTEMTGSEHETLFALTVLWLGERAFLELRRHSDGAPVAGAVGATEAEAWKTIERQLEILAT